MRVICGTLQRERESLIWMLSLLSVQNTHSCSENKLRRSQEGQQWMAWTPQRENKVHQLCAAQLSFASLPLALLQSAWGQRAESGFLLDSLVPVRSWACQGKSKRAVKAQRSTCFYETPKLLFGIAQSGKSTEVLFCCGLFWGKINS